MHIYVHILYILTNRPMGNMFKRYMLNYQYVKKEHSQKKRIRPLSKIAVKFLYTFVSLLTWPTDRWIKIYREYIYAHCCN